MTRCLIYSSLGVLSVGALPVLPGTAWEPVLIAVALAFTWLAIGNPIGLTRPIALFGLGVCWSLLVCQRALDDQVPAAWIGEPIWVEGEITDLPRVSEGIQRFVMDVNRAEPCQKAESARPGEVCAEQYRIRLSFYPSGQTRQVVKPGERWRFQVKLRPPRGLVNNATFSYEAWLLRHNISATGYVLVGAPNKKFLVQGNRRLFQQARYALRRFVTENLHYSAHQDLLIALLTGDSQAITHQHWDSLSRTGTNHLMIISGLHVSLVTGLAFRLFSVVGRLLLPTPIALKVTVTATSIVAVIYAGIAGLGLPVQRSLIMALVVFASLLLGRPVKTRNVFLWALLLVAVNDPLAPYSAGFWLSFLAVMLLLLLFSGRYRLEQKQTGLLADALFAQWGVYIGLFSVTAYLLLQVSVISMVANIIAIPVISLLVVPCSLVAIVSWLVAPEAGKVLLHMAEQILGHLWSYLEFLADINLVWAPPGASSIAAALGLLGGLLLLMPRGLPGRWLAACLVLPFIFPAPDALPAGQLRIRVMDVGQGLSVLLQTRHHSLVYDMGSRQTDRFDMGEMVVVPTLRLQRIRRLDKAIISNADNDHAGGAGSVLGRFDAQEVISGDPVSVMQGTGIQRQVSSCTRGSHWLWDGVKFEFLHPDGSGHWQGNDQSCVLLVSIGQASVLIPGDISSTVEARLMDLIHHRVDLLVVPHHGSDSSSSPAFLNRINPAYAIISAGYMNRFEHPRQFVVDRYRNRRVVLFSTSSDGAVEVTMNSSGIQSISGDRQLNPKFWFHRYLPQSSGDLRPL